MPSGDKVHVFSLRDFRPARAAPLFPGVLEGEASFVRFPLFKSHVAEEPFFRGPEGLLPAEAPPLGDHEGPKDGAGPGVGT